MRGRRTATLLLPVVAAAAVLWWLLGRSTIVTDWSEVARCQSVDHLDHRVTRTLHPGSCRTGLVRPADTVVEPGDAVLAVVLKGGFGDVPVVRSVSSDRAGRRVQVTSRIASSPAGGGLGTPAIAIGTLVFVALPARELPPTPFTLVDDFDETRVDSLGP